MESIVTSLEDRREYIRQAQYVCTVGMYVPMCMYKCGPGFMDSAYSDDLIGDSK